MTGQMLLVSLLLGTVSAVIRPIGTYNWASVASLGENVTFSCLLYKNESEPALPDNHQVVLGTERWQLPGKSELIGPWIDGRIKVNGDEMTVNDVALGDKGIYMCHVQLECINTTIECSNHTEMWFKHGLNLNGPLYANLMDKYQMNFIIAAAASGSTLVLFLVSCLIYKFRYKDPFKDEDDSADVNMYGQKIDAETSRL